MLEVADDFGIAFSGEKLESMHAGCLRDVIKRDLSFQTRRQSSRNSSGVLRKYADRRWLAFSKNVPDSPCTVFQITVRYGSTWRGCRRRGGAKPLKWTFGGCECYFAVSGCCGARSQLSNAPYMSSQLVRSAEIRARDGFWSAQIWDAGFSGSWWSHVATPHPRTA